MKKNVLIILSLLFVTGLSFSQSLVKNKFIIITFEKYDTREVLKLQKYYWIIPQDSIVSNKNTLYPVYLSAYSKNQFDDCNLGKSIDPSINPQEYGFDYTWDSAHEKLYQLIVKNRTLVQVIKKTWKSKHKQVIRIYATSVIGEFCSCNLAIEGQQRYGYKGNIFLAWNSVESYNEFWDLSIADFILRQDYSSHEFWKITARIQ